MDLYGADSLMAAAIGALGVIFVGAFIGLVLICRKQHQRQSQRWSRLEKRSKKGKNEQELAIALGDIGLNVALEQFLSDEQWVEDASGLIPHCLAILRACHSLTEQLINLALKTSLKRCSDRLIAAAKRIPSRVDSVIEAMYPPLDGRLLEARAATLVLAVGQMALLAQNAVGSQAGWIDKTLEEMDEHLFSLCEAVKEKGLFNREITVFL